MSTATAPRLRWRASILVAFAACLIGLAAAVRLEPLVGDLALAAAPRPSPAIAGDIVVVAITEDTLAGFPYRSPIDRAFLAGLVSHLDAAGARAVGIDILVDQPSDPAKDRAFFDAIDGAGIPVVLALATRKDGLTERQYSFVREHVLVRRHGLIALDRDEIDGVVRHLPQSRLEDSTRLATLTEALLPGPQPASLASSSAEVRPGRILYSRPVDAGMPTPFALYPAQHVALLPDDWFSGKTVLIGTDLPTIDRHPTPMVAGLGSAAGTIPGVVIHAHVLAQRLAGLSLPVAEPAMRGAATLAAALLAAMAFRLRLPPARLAGALGLGILAYLGLCLWSIAAGKLLPPLIAPPVAALAAAGLASLQRWQAERAQRSFLRLAFSRYVSPAVVERIASGRLALALGGEKRCVTYVFTDLEGFTTLSETLEPSALADILNPYLDEMCQLMTAHGATIDKIIGDAVVGFFGAPDDDPHQARHAVDLACALDAFAEEYRSRLREKGIQLGITRIGLHKGPAVVGNFGGSRFFDYTGIGDTVNTAARLEGANRFVGTRILLSDAVARDCPDSALRPVASLVLKGRAAPLAVFTPHAVDGPDSTTLRDAWASTYDILERHDQGAEQALTRFLDLTPGDPVATLHLSRLQAGETGATLVLAGK